MRNQSSRCLPHYPKHFDISKSQSLIQLHCNPDSGIRASDRAKGLTRINSNGLVSNHGGRIWAMQGTSQSFVVPTNLLHMRYNKQAIQQEKQANPIGKIANSIGKIGKLIGNALKYIDLYIKPIKMDGKWLGNGWGISNLCAPIHPTWQLMLCSLA